MTDSAEKIALRNAFAKKLGKTEASQTYLGIHANADSATKATQDGNGNNIADTYFAKAGGTVTGQIVANGGVKGNVTGNVTGDLTGTASKATADANGNNIVSTYAKQTDLTNTDAVAQGVYAAFVAFNTENGIS